MGRAEAEAKLAAAQTRRREAEDQLRQHEERLEELEDERESLVGATALARQALSDLAEYERRLEQELTALRAEELRAAFSKAVRARDEALNRASIVVAELAESLERVDAARAELTKSQRRLEEAGVAQAIPPEPTRFRDRWSAIAPLVEAELGRRLEYELVEAAAQSPNRLAFQSLPEHLRELAIKRRREIIDAAQERH